MVSALQKREAAQELTPVQQAMTNADPALSREQRSALEKLLLNYSTVFFAGHDDMGRASLIFHKIDNGESQQVRQGLRHIPHEHITVLKNEV